MFKKGKIAVVVLVAIAAGSIIYIYQLRGRDLVLNLIAPAEALIGVPMDLKVEFSNQSGNVLEDVLLTLRLPPGAVFVGSPEDQPIRNRQIGNIGEGSLISEDYQILFLEGQESVQEIQATLSYSPQALGAQFEISQTAKISIPGPGTEVELIGPERVFSGEDFDLEVRYRNVSPADFSRLELEMVYPDNFTFKKSTLKSDGATKDHWTLGALRQGSEGSFVITGNMIDEDSALSVFQARLKTTVSGESYDWEPVSYEVAIAPSPLKLSITVNGQKDYIAHLGEELHYVISYVNSSEEPLKNVTVRARLVSELLDFNTLAANRSLRVSEETVFWDYQNNPELALVSPQSAGFVDLKIKLKDNFSIRRFGDKNFVIKINVSGESPTSPSESASKTYSIAQLEIKVAGAVKLQATGYFRDADSGILNPGPMPPRVGQATAFTIHWRLSNFAVDVNGIEARARLEPGVRFTGQTKTNFPAGQLRADGNQIIWRLEELLANKGVVDQPLEAIFQVEATPDSQQIGKYLPLISETAVTATDNFTGASLTGTALPITTALPEDVTVGAQGGVVQP